MTFRLADPWMLLLILSIPPIVYLVIKRDRATRSSFRFSAKKIAGEIKDNWRLRASRKLPLLTAAGLTLMIVAISRPQTSVEKTNVLVEGIDIVLAVDVSSSMMAMDFEIAGKRVDRLQVVKMVVSDFVAKRPNDRIGLIAFSGLAYTVCPLTLDHDWLDKNLERVRIGMIEDGTAIGSAISAAVNRLKNSEAKEKVVILLTDGRNNAGRVSPLAAAEAARAMGVRVYTIGAGTKGMAPFPMKDMLGNTVMRPVEIQIDDELLKNIAGITHARYFRATDTGSLLRIYEEIDKLEKTRMEETGYNIYSELFGYFLVPGIMLVVLGVVLSNTVLRRIP